MVDFVCTYVERVKVLKRKLTIIVRMLGRERHIRTVGKGNGGVGER